MGWFGDLWSRWFGGSEGSTGIGAAELMREMREEKLGDADPAAWAEGLATLRSRVFSGPDRARLWRRARRKHPGEVVELELVTRPTGADLAALRDLLRELDRA